MRATITGSKYTLCHLQFARLGSPRQMQVQNNKNRVLLLVSICILYVNCDCTYDSTNYHFRKTRSRKSHPRKFTPDNSTRKAHSRTFIPENTLPKIFPKTHFRRFSSAKTRSYENPLLKTPNPNPNPSKLSAVVTLNVIYHFLALIWRCHFITLSWVPFMGRPLWQIDL
jgi:hypothetical protein